MTTVVPSICDSCTHRRTAITCDAWPDLIPIEISTLGGDHRMPIPGDHGIQWEWDEDKVDERFWWEKFYQAGLDMGLYQRTPGAPELAWAEPVGPVTPTPPLSD